jgi:hypothetical protein
MEMKTYQSPKMEVIVLTYQKPLLDASGETAGGGGSGYARELDVEE